jgi:hypothetical protein
MHGNMLGIVKECLEEVHCETSYNMKLYRMKKMTAEVNELKSMTLKQPSPIDLMLIQVAIDNPEIKGIITYDTDFINIATKGIVQKKGGNFWVGDAEEFLELQSKKQKWKKLR